MTDDMTPEEFDAAAANGEPAHLSVTRRPESLIVTGENRANSQRSFADPVAQAEVERLRAKIARVEAEVDQWINLTEYDNELGAAICYDNAVLTIVQAERRIREALADREDRS